MTDEHKDLFKVIRQNTKFRVKKIAFTGVTQGII